MNIRSKRFVVVMLTLVFAVSVFTVTAFAENVSSTVTLESQASEPNAGPSAPADSTVGETSSATSTQAPSEGSGTLSSGSSPSVPSSTVSHATVSSRAQTASSKYQAPVTSLDTKQNQVEATASEAAAAVSDPDVLSSENWSELLSSGEETQSQAAIAGTSTVSSTASTAGVGGVSMILILGVVLIVLALCGFGLFVYLQFFANRNGPKGRGGQGKPKSSPRNADPNNEDTITFTDISSDSDGKVHRGDYVPNKDAKAPSKPQSTKNPPSSTVNSPSQKPQSARKAPVTDKEVTAPIPHLSQSSHSPSPENPGSNPPLRAQATPVSKESDFDWEKFFNEQN